MKNKPNLIPGFYFLVVIMSFAFKPANCQETKNAITTNLMGVLARIGINRPYRLDLMYERVVQQNMSLCLSVGKGMYYYGNKTVNLKTTEEYNITGFVITPELRIYPLSEKVLAPEGFFIGAYAKQFFLTENYATAIHSIKNSGNATGGGIELGYKATSEKVLIEPLLGFGSGIIKGVNKDNRIDPFYLDIKAWEFFIRIELRLGLTF